MYHGSQCATARVEELVPEMVEKSKNTGFDQVMEAVVLSEFRLDPEAMMESQGRVFNKGNTQNMP